jgi:hypothetical protein
LNKTNRGENKEKKRREKGERRRRERGEKRSGGKKHVLESYPPYSRFAGLISKNPLTNKVFAGKQL